MSADAQTLGAAGRESSSGTSSFTGTDASAASGSERTGDAPATEGFAMDAAGAVPEDGSGRFHDQNATAKPVATKRISAAAAAALFVHARFDTPAPRVSTPLKFP